MTEAKCLMVQGTASSVGKSVLVAALCRILRQDGFRVAPFKAQNMALNSAVTPDGLELGRAQAVQAEAAGIVPAVEMNPILLKPEADNRSQVVVRGRPVDVLAARDYYRRRESLWPIVTESLASLRATYDVIVIEGAGSPAEVNLRDLDIVNMSVALHARAAVLLLGDIDRGGVFAALVGTLELLDQAERDLVKGLVINKFRGDASLLTPGVRFLEERTSKPVLGVIPYLEDVGISEEDSVVLEGISRRSDNRRVETGVEIEIALVKLPYLANFDDFDPLGREPSVRLSYVTDAGNLGSCDLIILPGTKTTLADLAWLKRTGLAQEIVARASAGTAVIGICGGFQMLGEQLADPLGVEGRAGCADGLGLLPASTTFEPKKTTCQVRARIAAGHGLLVGMEGREVRGYEIHMGRTQTRQRQGRDARPAFGVIERSGQPSDGADGLLDADGLVLGTYLHGLFDNDVFRRGLLSALARRKGATAMIGGSLAETADRYDLLAAHFRAHLDVPRVYQLAGLRS